MHAPISSSVIILDTVVKSTLLLALAWGVALVLKRRSAATQHMVRTFALAALLLLPVSVMLVPTWHIKGLPQYPKSHVSIEQQAAQPSIAPLPLSTGKAPTAPAKSSVASIANTPANSRIDRAAHSASSPALYCALALK